MLVGRGDKGSEQTWWQRARVERGVSWLAAEAFAERLAAERKANAALREELRKAPVAVECWFSERQRAERAEAELESLRSRLARLESERTAIELVKEAVRDWLNYPATDSPHDPSGDSEP